MRRSGFLRVLAGLAVMATLSGCGGGDTPLVSYAPPSYDYLTKLRLNVATVDIDDSWAPRPESHDLGMISPTHPVDALRQMARDRLVANGNTGHALFGIDEASLVQVRDRYEGRMTIHLDIASGDGSRTGYAEARVIRSRAIENDAPNATRAALNELVTQMMEDMNVELEFQIRRSLRSYLQKGAPAAPVPAPVQQEDLPALPKG